MAITRKSFFLMALLGLSCIELMGQPVEPDSIATYRLQDLVVTASRLPEEKSQAGVALEKLNQDELWTRAAPSFFDALEQVRGVHMLVPSMGFKVLNTRGFSNTTNVRFVQLVDGRDVQAPHLGAPIANVLVPSDLDIASVEVVPGSASALYGMNAINGLANFSTKNPFASPGISAMQKTGFNGVGEPRGPQLFSETSVRWAHRFSDKWAFKINGTWIRGDDWQANSLQDLAPQANATTNLLGPDNPALDPVNSYGNEAPNRRALALLGKNYVVARTGYLEREVASYRINNLKADGSLHYHPTKNTQLVYQYRFAQLDNIYQRANRFRLEDYLLQQHAITFQSYAWKAHMYVNTENTGRSYNLRSMAENIDRSFKTDPAWFGDYQQAFERAVATGAAVPEAHWLARVEADRGRPLPGTDDFRSKLDELRSINNWDVGAALQVRARMLHAEAQWNATAGWLRPLRERWGMEVLAGFDHRTYLIIPDGNYFVNPETDTRNLTYSRTGSFLQAALPVGTNLRLGAALRADKNEYFPVKFNPRLTAVYNFNPTARVRMAIQNGFRFPSVFEAFSNVNSGGVKRVGGLRVMSSGIFESSYNRASIDAFQAAILRDLNGGMPREEAIRKNAGLIQLNDYTYLVPEQIRSLEVGYQDSYFNDRLRLDIDFYINRYQDLIAQVEVNIPRTTQSDSVAFYLADRTRQDRYRMWTNSKTRAYNLGSSAHLLYQLPRHFQMRAQAAFARLQRTSRNDGLEDGFNTPEWVLAGTLANRSIFRQIGFELTHRWQRAYYWQSFLVSGRVPSFYTLDAQLTNTGKHATVKIGATNALNRYYYSFLGGPSVGGFYYVTLVVGGR